MHSRKKLSRRAFLRAGTLASVGWAVGCAPAPATPTPTAVSSPEATEAASSTPVPSATATWTPVATATTTATTQPTDIVEPTATVEPGGTARPTQTPAPDPTATSAPTLTPTAPPTPMATPTPLIVTPAREDLVTHYPHTAHSVVSVVQSDRVWDGDQIVSPVVLHMLDAAIVQLTGIDDALTAWKALFDPGETVGIKVNTISRYTTTPAVAYAIAQRLQDAGLPAGQITLFDRTDRELIDRGFTINVDGPGVRCRGAKAWEQPSQVAGTSQRVHDVMLSCDALINVPVFKEHSISGFSAALKNHYGTIHGPGQLHGNNCDPYIPELNALPVIQDKTRLIVGDALRTSPYDWNRMTKENMIVMSFDPVAHDLFARQVLIDRRTADNRPGQYITALSHYLDTAIKIGLGADVAHSQVRKTSL